MSRGRSICGSALSSPSFRNPYSGLGKRLMATVHGILQTSQAYKSSGSKLRRCFNVIARLVLFAPLHCPWLTSPKLKFNDACICAWHLPENAYHDILVQPGAAATNIRCCLSTLVNCLLVCIVVRYIVFVRSIIVKWSTESSRP